MKKEGEKHESFVEAVLSDRLEKEIVRLVTTDEPMDQIVSKLLALLHND